MKNSILIVFALLLLSIFNSCSIDDECLDSTIRVKFEQERNGQNVSNGGGTTSSSEEKKYVDLGLPSGTLWAMTNLGAKSHEESGTYFQWGCVKGGDEWNPCKTFDFSIQNTKYDAAYVLWGSGWMIPNVEQANELCTYCTSEIVTEKGVNCYKMTSIKNGKSIYFPIAGYYYGTSNMITKTQYSALYWTSEPNLYFSDSYYEAKYLQIPQGVDGTSTGMTKNSRLPIRAVKKR